MRPLPAVAVALLVLAAGCSGFDALGGAGDGGPRTVDPALRSTPTPTPSPTPVSTPPGGLPPGVTADGVDPERLVDAHRAALANRSFTLTRRRTARDANGTVVLNATVRVRVDDRAELVRRAFVRRSRERAPRTRTAAYWTNGSVTVQRETATDERAETAVSRGGPPPARAVDPTGAEAVRALLTEFNASLAGTLTADGRRLAVLRVRDERVDDPPTRSADLRMLVAPDGTVVSYRLVYWTTWGDRDLRVVDRFAVSNVGATAVDRPEWVDEALSREATNRTAGEGTDAAATPTSGAGGATDGTATAGR